MAARPLRSAYRAARNLRKVLRGERLDWNDALDMIPVIGSGISIAATAFGALRAHREIGRAVDQLNQLQGDLNALQSEVASIARDWDRNNCGGGYSW